MTDQRHDPRRWGDDGRQDDRLLTEHPIDAYYRRKREEAERLSAELREAEAAGDTDRIRTIARALERARYVGD